ncbi:trypsin-like peptidase domain-containing protein [Lentzea albida]|uniref:Trypsin-like peptidase domain-containing protein n=1 Tax=Lentzea albida TaxID=65499 RepID=A0A1H9MNS3_9PSEU|nr:trypsin-like peptidase domain-containing protein [Lentzea albida]SER25288.1 hypothetical protein SAMN04488000_107134 [Lentzea albida]
MYRTEYWVEARRPDGGVLGAGFYVTRRFVMTADHCLRPLAESESDVVLVHADGTEAPGVVCERREDVDLALIRLVGRSFVRPPVPQVCKKNDRWRTPNRPSPSDPHLNGAVDEPNVKYDCVSGTQLEALQLSTEVVLGNYEGYSGSAVERVGEEATLAGVLQEQYQNRFDEKLGATNVLWAVTMREAFAAFADYFDDHAPADPATDVRRHTSALEQLADWEAHGLVGPSAVNTIQLEIARAMVEQFLSKGSA